MSSKPLSATHAPSWTDTHCHLNDDALCPKLGEVLQNARLANVARIICVAVDAESSRDSLERIAAAATEATPRVFFSAGIHPNYAHQESPGDWDLIQNLLDDRRIVALGETGLDKYWDDCPFETQQSNFRRHFEASRETGLPVIIHSRDCEDEMLQALRSEHRHGKLRGVMHSFTGGHDMARECIDMGLYISFSGIVTYKKNAALREIATRIPLDRILLETDAPYLSPEPMRSVRPNEPSLMVHTAATVANALGMHRDDLAEATTRNALQLFQRMT